MMPETTPDVTNPPQGDDVDDRVLAVLAEEDIERIAQRVLRLLIERPAEVHYHYHYAPCAPQDGITFRGSYTGDPLPQPSYTTCQCSVTKA
jgi:hypothetical protein